MSHVNNDNYPQQKSRKRNIRGNHKNNSKFNNQHSHQQQQHHHQFKKNCKRPRSNSNFNEFKGTNNSYHNQQTNEMNNGCEVPKANEHARHITFDDEHQYQQETQLIDVDTFLNSSITSVAGNSTVEFRIAILPKNYPITLLSNAELSKLEDAIIDEVKLGWQAKLMFDDIHVEDSMLLIDCATKDTADWLLQAASKLKTWNGPKLCACKENELITWYCIKVNFPKSSEQNPSETLALIEAQNTGLNTKLWRLKSCENNGNLQLLTIAVDENSKNTIIESGYTMRYRFGKVYVFEIDKGTKYLLTDDNVIPPADVSHIQLSSDEAANSNKIDVVKTPKVTLKKIFDKKNLSNNGV